MDALKMATVDSPNIVHTMSRPSHLERSEIRLAPRLVAALAGLLEAVDYVQDLEGSVWEFALELPSLRRLNLSNSDLRWLVGKGLVEHALETTLAGDKDRSFRRPSRLLFCKKTCFVLTPSGTELAREICGSHMPGLRVDERTATKLPSFSVAAQLDALVPKWDRDRQELKVGPAVIKRFKVPAVNQEMVLAAFEEEGWPPRIDDPLPPHGEQAPKRRLQETIKSLNRNQKRTLIRFLGDGSGQGVRWEFCGHHDTSREA